MYFLVCKLESSPGEILNRLLYTGDRERQERTDLPQISRWKGNLLTRLVLDAARGLDLCTCAPED